MVCTSASAWQGWKTSLSALITGTRDHCASPSTVFCEKTRATMPLTQRSRLRATSFKRLAHADGAVHEDRGAAQLLDGEFEGEAGAQRRLFEQQGDRLVVESVRVVARASA